MKVSPQVISSMFSSLFSLYYTSPASQGDLPTNNRGGQGDQYWALMGETSQTPGPRQGGPHTRGTGPVTPRSPLHGIGDHPGRVMTPNYPRGQSGAGIVPMAHLSGGAGPPHDVVTRAIVHDTPSNLPSTPQPPGAWRSPGQGEQRQGWRPGSESEEVSQFEFKVEEER